MPLNKDNSSISMKAEDIDALNWANNNQNDPKSIAIKQHLGKKFSMGVEDIDALNWANNNQNDPRSIAIKEHLGKKSISNAG